MAGRILVLRSSGERESDPTEGDDLHLLVTHRLVVRLSGVDEVRLFEIHPGDSLVISSPSAVRLLHSLGEAALFSLPFANQIASGEETARAMERAGAPPGRVTVPPLPGAAGILHAFPPEMKGSRVLWPRGSDADGAPLRELMRREAEVIAPVIYEKRREPIEESEEIELFTRGIYSAVAVSSLAAFDAFQDALRAFGRVAPSVRWGVLGPETARGMAARGFPLALVASAPRLADLISELQNETGLPGEIQP